MLTPLALAPITPSLEALIGHTGFVPVTVHTAATQLRTTPNFAHKPELLDMDLSPWVPCTITGARFKAGIPTEYTVELEDGDLLTLAPDGLVFVQRSTLDDIDRLRAKHAGDDWMSMSFGEYRRAFPSLDISVRDWLFLSDCRWHKQMRAARHG